MRSLMLFIVTSFLLSSAIAQNDSVLESFIPYYKTFGEGSPIVIINGGPGMNSKGFEDIAQKIAAMGYQTILFDQRGTGNSKLEEISAETINMELMVEDMENLRKKLNIDQWMILGHSFGGLLATAYYDKHPDRVEKIIYSSSGGVNLKFTEYVQERIRKNLTPKEFEWLSYYGKKLEAGDHSLKTIKKRAGFLAKAYVYNKSFAPKIAERLLEVNFHINGLVFKDLNQSQFDFTGKFVDRLTPVIVFQGKNDIIREETAIEIKNSFGNASLVMMDRCGHYGWLDSPEIFFRHLEEFLNKK